MGFKKMKKALTSVIVSIAMVAASVSATAADTANTEGKPAVQTGPLSPGGAVLVSPAQGTVVDTLGCGYDINGICGPIVLLGVAGMGVAIAAIMGAFAKAHLASQVQASTTTTGTGG